MALYNTYTYNLSFAVDVDSVTLAPDIQVIDAGQIITLTCTVVGEDPDKSTKWTKNGQVVTEGKKIKYCRL